MIALRNGHKYIAMLLLKTKTDVKSSNSAGGDALIIAAQCKQDYAIPILIKAGTDLKRQDGTVCSMFTRKLLCIGQHSME
jgi:ankyrin repeat protein